MLRKLSRSTWLKRLKLSDGQDLLEYALLVALIAIIAIAAVTHTGNEVRKVFRDVAKDMKKITKKM